MHLLSPVVSEPVSLTCLSLGCVQSKPPSNGALWWVTSGVGKWPRFLFGFTSDVRPNPQVILTHPVKSQRWTNQERSLPSRSFWSNRVVYNLIF